MAFSQATITHTFQNADGTPGSGSVTFQLSKRMSNGTIDILPGEITANLNGSGVLSQALTANNDPGTIPTDATWIVTLRLLGDSTATYSIVVPTGGGTVDLATLLPQNPQGG